MPRNCVALPAVSPAVLAEFHHLPLLPHPACGPGPLRALSVSGTLSAAGLLSLDYLLQGDLHRIRMPATAADPQRRDELWRHTCLELFARRDPEAAYLEFNFSPCGDWAAYRFDSYRQGQSCCSLQPLAIALRRLGSGQMLVQTRTPLPTGSAGAWRLGLAAVIEADDGSLSYWAVRHVGAQPDFHAAAGFSLSVSACDDGARPQAGAC